MLLKKNEVLTEEDESAPTVGAASLQQDPPGDVGELSPTDGSTGVSRISGQSCINLQRGFEATK